MHHEKLGIYLNTKECHAMRINSQYWIPSGDQWVFLSPEVNATMTMIRELVKAKGLVGDPEKIVWGDWSQVPRRDWTE